MEKEKSNFEQNLELYKIIREQIVHEDNLGNQRINWFLSSHAFLYAAYFIVFVAKQNLDINLYAISLGFICVFGLIISIFIQRGLIVSGKSLRILRKFWYSKNKDEGKYFEMNQNYESKEFPDINYWNEKDKEFDKNLQPKNSITEIYSIMWWLPTVFIFSWLTLIIFTFSTWITDRSTVVYEETIKTNEIEVKIISKNDTLSKKAKKEILKMLNE
jgi:hypothetical protein